MYSVQSTPKCVQCTLYREHCTAYTERCTVCSTHFTVSLYKALQCKVSAPYHKDTTSYYTNCSSTHLNPGHMASSASLRWHTATVLYRSWFTFFHLKSDLEAVNLFIDFKKVVNLFIDFEINFKTGQVSIPLFNSFSKLVKFQNQFQNQYQKQKN